MSGVLILAAAISAAVAAGTPATIKATASEDGIADLGRIVADGAFDGTQAAQYGRLVEASYFTQVAAKSGKVPLYAGSGTGEMPLALFDGRRGQEVPVGLGYHKLNASEWAQLVAAPHPVAGNMGWACPFIPAQARSRVQRPNGPLQVAAFVPSGTVDKDATTGTLTFTTTEAGVLDLGSFAIGAASVISGARKEFDSSLDGLFINSWTLPGNEDLIVGSGTAPSAPASAFYAGRSFDFFDLGCIFMGASTSVTITLSNYSERTLSPFGTAAFWPGATGRPCAC